MNLLLQTSPILGEPETIMRLPDTAHVTWKHVNRLQGGMWTANFTVVGDKQELNNWYYNWIGKQVLEKHDGIPTWVGMITDVELKAGNFSRKRSITDMWNSVAVRYSNNGQQTTSYTTNDKSIAEFGTKQTIEMIQGQNVALSVAEQKRDDYLNKHGWPFSEAQNKTSGKLSLSVQCAGYVFTLNWFYATSGSGTVNLSQRINDVAIFGDYISDFYVQNENTNQIDQKLSSETRGWDLIKNLLDVGESGNLYRMFVLNRTGYYGVIDTNPRYYVKNGYHYDTPACLNPVPRWNLRPGVYRDLDWPIRYSLSNGYLEDPRDVLVAEVTISTGNVGLNLANLADPLEIIQPNPPTPEPPTPNPPTPNPPTPNPPTPNPPVPNPPTPPGGPCFVSNTPITMANGSILYNHLITKNDRIRSYDTENGVYEVGLVTSVMKRFVDGYYEIELSNGTVLGVTGEHPFYAPNHDMRIKNAPTHEGFVRVKNLKSGDDLFEHHVKEIQYIKKRTAVYNFSIKTYRTYIANGVIVHNVKDIPDPGEL